MGKELLPLRGEAVFTFPFLFIGAFAPIRRFLLMSEESLYLPVVALRGRLALPEATTSFDAGRLMTLAAVKNALQSRSDLIAVAQCNEELTDISADNLYTVGVVISVARVTNLPGNKIRIFCKGLYRVKISEYIVSDDCLYATAQAFPSVEDSDENLTEAYFRTAKYSALSLIDNSSVKMFTEDVVDIIRDSENKEAVLYNILSALKISVAQKQEVLEREKLTDAFDLLCEHINNENEIAGLERKINSAVKRNIEKGQKDYYLREQLKVIHGELGDDESELDELKVKIEEKKLPEEAHEKALKELSRLSRLPATSPDYNVIRNYLDWIIDLEWNKETEDTEKLEDAVKILNNDHYGLEKIKERITEYLAVLKLTGGMNAPILCLVGPPGVGKTSIASSIARALGRKFTRMSLGGVSDEAEIRGHRKTYVGAMPGRIITAIKNAGSINPVFLLDEVDKLSTDRFHGDMSSALLEALDPAQNATFRDRYLEVPYDLSKVLFITTANDLSAVPAPLRDRMEVIEISGYTSEEKKEIAKRYLVPKKRAANGLDENNVKITDAAISFIESGYTREAGVRELERQIDAVMRKLAVKKAEGKSFDITVKKSTVEELLGAPRYHMGDEILKKDAIGAACGLAWTAVGGTTLTIEVSAMQGKGDVLLTGKLGDVMRESARAAISYIRSNAELYGLNEEQFEKTDIHVHVPEGATPKDGPSAGITMATAILSAFTKKPVRHDIAMTGEITLLGRVLPIGGLKEKSLAAYRIGVRDVIIPQDNMRDLDEVPPVVRENVHFIPVDNVSEVFRNAIIGI